MLVVLFNTRDSILKGLHVGEFLLHYINHRLLWCSMCPNLASGEAEVEAFCVGYIIVYGRCLHSSLCSYELQS